MRKWLFCALFSLTLMVCLAPAQAAVVSGGVEYVWYTGEAGLYISCDRGGSYAVLPELETAREDTGLAYAIVVEPNAIDDGGLSVKGRDIWSTEYTWFREYSAQELAAALEKPAKVTPVRVHATNGRVTVGSRDVKDYGNDDLSRHLSAGNLLDGEYAGDRIVYSTDGVTWLPAEGEGKLNWLGSIWWDGEAFRSSDGGRSSDGIHWTGVWTGAPEEWLDDPTYALSCELGPYRFEYAENDAGECGVYLMDRTDPEWGVLLPHMGEAARAKGVNIGTLRAWYGPNDTVILAAYDVYMKEKMMVSIDYPISSLDWCLENLKTQFRYINFQVDNGAGVGLGVAASSKYRYEGELVRREGSDIQWVKTPFRQVQRIYPYNGKTFVVWGDGKLYASEDGLSWTCLEGKGLGDEWDRKLYSFVWTGDRYISCRRTVQYSAGRAGTWGERYDPACTRVSFLNENFETIASYDFGRQVEAVGYLDGTYYAEVSDSAGVSTIDYMEDAPSTLYRSTDGKTWERLPDIYIDYEDIMVSTKGGSGVGNQPTGDANKPLRMVAQLDGYRFALKKIGDDYTVGLMMNNAQDWMELDGLREAIQSHWIIPGEVSARYTADGRVEVTVTDLSTPGMKCSTSCFAASLNESLKTGVRTEDGVWDKYHIDEPEEEQSKPGIADVAVMSLLNGEREIVYRTAATDGKYMYYDSVPWSNSVELLPFSGKDFMVLDKADGRLYLSPDGVNWHEATGNWVVNNRVHNYWEYAFVWTGEHYLGVCMLADDIAGDGVKVVGHREWARESCEVACLDENLEYLRIANLDAVLFTTAVGCRYGICYVQLQDGRLLKSPNGGKGWLETDVTQVRKCLVGLK